MQTVIVILIIAVAVFFSVRKTLRIIKGKDRNCNCGCKDCHCNKKEI